MKHTDVYKRKSSDSSASSTAYDDRLVVKLLRNYRSHPDILHIPNRSFYDSDLQPCADEAGRTLLCRWPGLPKQGFPLVFHGIVGRDEREERSPSFFNVDEITVVTRYVAELLESRQPRILQKQIGIISPYRKQVCTDRLASSHVTTDRCVATDWRHLTSDRCVGTDWHHLTLPQTGV